MGMTTTWVRRCASRRQELSVIVLCSLLAGAALADRRADDNLKAERGLARLDSLLQVPEPEKAVEVARHLQSTIGEHPVYGWQIAGRLGLALLLTGEPEMAVPLLENAALQHPGEAAYHRNLGSALLQLNRRGRALSEFQVAVELAPGDPVLRQEYGQMLLSFGDIRAASRELHLARELCDGCEEMDRPLASLYLLQESFDLAVPLLRRLHQREPSAEARHTLVAAMSRAGDDSLLMDFLSALPAGERAAAEWRLLVEAEGRRGGSTHSLVVVKQLRALAADEELPSTLGDDHLWGQVALNLLAVGEFNRGLLAVDHAIALAPDNVVYRNNRVVLLTRLGRDNDARAEWEKVLALDPSRAGQSP